MLDAVCVPRVSPKNHGVKSAALVNAARANMKKVLITDIPVSLEPSDEWVSRQQKSLIAILAGVVKITVTLQGDCFYSHVGEEHATKERKGLGFRKFICAGVPFELRRSGFVLRSTDRSR